MFPFKTIIFIFVVAFLATVGYTVPWNSPKRIIPVASAVGAIAYLIYYILLQLGINYTLASFLASFTIGLFGELFSRKFHIPATIVILPGIITLVPGGGMYYTMLHLIQEEYELFFLKGIETFFIAAAISLGIVISTLFSTSIKSVRQNTKLHMNPKYTHILKKNGSNNTKSQ